ncbi:MAG: hypothetical protein IKN85_05240 [Oscillospiraceae bacterium]|nr:hypothetical protein [Oscillospiraceae bacterium]
MIVKRLVRTLFLGLCALCMLSSCKNVERPKEVSTADESQSVSAVIETRKNDTDSDSVVITYDTNGDSFFYGKDLYYNELKLTNIKTGERKYVCNVPGCLHEADSKDCTVIEETPWSYFSAVCGNKISYYNFDKKEVRMINTDGSDIRTIAEVNDYNTMNEIGKILVGSHLYCLVQLRNTFVDETGYVNDVSGVTRLYDLDFDSEKLSVIYEGDKVVYSAPGYIRYSDEKLCFSYEDHTKKYEDSGITKKEYMSNREKYMDRMYEILGLEEHIIILDLGTGKCREIEWEGPEGQPSAHPHGFINNVLYCPGNNGIYSYDLETNEQKVVYSGAYGYLVYQSADFVLLRWSNSADYSGGYEYAIIENGDSRLKKLENSDMGDFFITDECYEQLKLQYFDAGIDAVFDPKRVEFMDREEFKNMFK